MKKHQSKMTALAALLAASLVMFTACNEGVNTYSYRADADYAMEEETVDAPSAGMSENGISEQNAKAKDARKIIYSCSYTVETKEFDESVAKLNELMNKYGAYNENAEIYGNAEESGRTAYFTIRVPVENYDAFRSEAGSIGTVVRSAEQNRDVSESYFDTEARLASAKLHEERLLAILEKADSLEEVLQLENSLADVRYEIESLSGTLKKFDSLISYSTIDVTIEEVARFTPVNETPKTFGDRVGQAIKGSIEAFAEGMENFLIILIYALPLLLTLGLIALIIVLLIKGGIKHHRKKAAALKAAEIARQNEEITQKEESEEAATNEEN